MQQLDLSRPVVALLVTDGSMQVINTFGNSANYYRYWNVYFSAHGCVQSFPRPAILVKLYLLAYLKLQSTCVARFII